MLPPGEMPPKEAEYIPSEIPENTPSPSPTYQPPPPSTEPLIYDTAPLYYVSPVLRLIVGIVILVNLVVFFNKLYRQRLSPEITALLAQRVQV